MHTIVDCRLWIVMMRTGMTRCRPHIQHNNNHRTFFSVSECFVRACGVAGNNEKGIEKRFWWIKFAILAYGEKTKWLVVDVCALHFFSSFRTKNGHIANNTKKKTTHKGEGDDGEAKREREREYASTTLKCAPNLFVLIFSFGWVYCRRAVLICRIDVILMYAYVLFPFVQTIRSQTQAHW